MVPLDNTLIVLAGVLFFALVVPEFFKKFQLPFASSLIILGAVLGPNMLNYFKINETMELFGFLGAAFLMLLTGLEAKADHLKELRKKIAFMTFLNAFFPFIVGTIIVLLFGYELKSALLVGILFISSSAALIFSAVKTLHIERTSIAHAITGVVILEDIISLVMLTVLFEVYSAKTRYPILIFLGLLVSAVIMLRMFLPEIVRYFFSNHKHDDENEFHLRVIIAALLVVVILFSGLGINSIIAAFLVGLILSDLGYIEKIKIKIHVIGYSLFVPIFFFVLGMETNLNFLVKFDAQNFLMISLVLGLFASKYISGYISAKIEGFTKYNAMFFGTISATKLTTTLSAAYIGFSLNLIDSTILTSIIILSVLSTLISPIAAMFIEKVEENAA